MASKNQIVVNAELREGRGKGCATKMRRNGRIPGIVYGHGVEPVAVAVSQGDMQLLASHPSIVRLEVAGGQAHNVMIKDVQRDYLRDAILHADFLAVRMDEKLRTTVRIETTGEAAGIHQGGQLEQPLHEIEIECLPGDLPESIVVDVSGLEMDQAVKVGELVLPHGVEIASADAEALVAHVVLPRVADEESAETEQAGEGAEEGETAAGAEAAKEATDE